MNAWKPYRGRLVFTGLGLITAMLFMTIGFWRTILILLCCLAGYAIGVYVDGGGKGAHIPERLRFWRTKW